MLCFRTTCFWSWGQLRISATPYQIHALSICTSELYLPVQFHPQSSWSNSHWYSLFLLFNPFLLLKVYKLLYSPNTGYFLVHISIRVQCSLTSISLNEYCTVAYLVVTSDDNDMDASLSTFLHSINHFSSRRIKHPNNSHECTVCLQHRQHHIC